MSEMAAVVGWYGPYYDLTSARNAARNDYNNGLYAVFGYEKMPIRGRPRMLYVGVGAPLYNRLTSSHHKIGNGKIAKITSIWLGTIESHHRPGKREKKIEPLMDIVEWAMVSLLDPCLNERRRTFPDRSFAIMNRWWSKEDYETPVGKPFISWPDIIECAGQHASAHLCWLEHKKVREFARPRALTRVRTGG